MLSGIYKLGGYSEFNTIIFDDYDEVIETLNQAFDIGVDNLRIRDIYEMPNGSTKIVSEQYWVRRITYYDNSCHCMKTKYDTYADDIFVMSIDAKGKLEWVKKIPKAQHSSDAIGDRLSINPMITGNDLHIFYIDNIKNLNLPATEAPKVHQNRMGGFLTAVTVNEKGDVKKFSLGQINDFDTNFFIRGFEDGGNNNGNLTFNLSPGI